MNNVAKFVFASVFALSGAVPAFAAHTSKMGESAEHPESNAYTRVVRWTPGPTRQRTCLLMPGLTHQMKRRSKAVLISELAVSAERSSRPRH